MNIVICDDDKNICAFLAQRVKAFCPDADVRCLYDGKPLLQMAVQSTAQGALEKEPDILLLDIELGGIDGMELAKKLRETGWENVILIFVTAYADYVFDAFDVGAFHYLVKPVSEEKLAGVLHKASMQIASRPVLEKVEDMQGGKRITVKSGGVSTSVRASDIVYAEVFNRKVVIHTMHESIEYYGKLKSLENELGSGFYRPHRAYLVAFQYITKYDSSVIFLEDGSQVMMAKQNYAGFVKAYMAYMKRIYKEMPEKSNRGKRI